METIFLPKSPHVYSDPYLLTISLSAGVGVASLHMKPILTKQTYSQGQLTVGDMLQLFQSFTFLGFLY